MATSFPGAVDSFPRPGPGTFRDDPTMPLSTVIDNLSDALEAVETKVLAGGGGPILLSGYWSASDRLAPTPSGGPWPIINRAYFIDFPIPGPVTITAVAFNVTNVAGAGNVVRLGVWADNNGTPGTLLEQTTVAGDVAGMKTWTLTTPRTFSGSRFWLAAGPQGSGSPGETWFSTPATAGHAPTAENGAAYLGASFNPACAYISTSGAYTSNPALTLEQVSSRNPHMLVRIQ